MKQLELVRFAHTPDGIFGRLGRWYTLENVWKDNQRGKSAIPTGTYKCVRDYYHTGGYPTFEIRGVPGRSRILFHIGNWDTDTEGCILLGLGMLSMRNKIALTRSGDAFHEFMDFLASEDEFELLLRDHV